MSQCPECNRYHRGKLPRQGFLQTIPFGEPWEKLSIDITGPHPKSRRDNIYILTMMCQFSKYVEVAALPNQEAATVAKALVETVIVRYGCPLQILSDRGTNFESKLFQELCQLLGIDMIGSTSYKPTTNGMIERFHGSINRMLGKFIHDNQRNWDECLPYVLAVYRSSLHEVTGFTPNKLIFGHENRMPIDLVYGLPTQEKEAENQPNYSNYVEDLCQKIEEMYREVRLHLKTAAERRKRCYDMKVTHAVFKSAIGFCIIHPGGLKERVSSGNAYILVRFWLLDNYELQKSSTSKSFIVHVEKCGNRIRILNNLGLGKRPM